MKNKFTTIKKLIALVLIAFSFAANATTYYFSASGNDANNGTSTSTPWKTVAKFNSVFASKSAGDNFLFNRGDVFYGRMNITRSGASGSPITMGAYGTGAIPVITGFTTVTSWTNLGSNIWESISPVATLSYINMVVINGINTAMGRYPNTGYFPYQSNTGNTSITSSSLSGSPDWTGAELVMFATRASFSKAPITAQSGGKLTFTPSPKITVWDQNVPQFFIQGDPRTLDTTNEWYFNPSTKKLRIYNSSTPANVQLATVDTLVYLNGRNYITFDNISFQGSNIVSMGINSSQYITIQNCDFNFSGRDAIDGPWTNSSTGLDIENNTINHSNNNAIYLSQICDNARIRYNTITNSGVIPGMTYISDGNCYAIVAPGPGTLIEYNTIDSVGYTAIKFFGSNTTINNNYLRSFCLILRDGGGIYTWNGSKTVQSGIKILNNIVLNNNVSSGLNTENYGIYLDDLSNNIEITGNTSANCGWGIELHSVTNVTVKNNTTYNNSMASIFLMSDNGAGSVPGLTVMDNIQLTNNIFFAKTTRQKTLWLYPLILPVVPPDFHSDSNYYARPIDNNGLSILSNYQPKGGTQVLTNMNLPLWQTFCQQEAHSKVAPKAISDTNDLRFEYNATTSSKTITLDGNYVDVKNVSYNGSITLAPFTSAVLTRNGAAKNQPPVAYAGSDQTITLPTNSVTLSASGTDPDGNISAYNWTEISGPSTATITTAISATTSVTGLVQGVYQFQLKVTDNVGATGQDTVRVTVNAATNISPIANAGPDQSITLPASVNLSGSGTDTDGNISAYDWTKISGPAPGIITNATSASTSVTGLVQGVYQFQLRVIDNAGAAGQDTVQIIVSAAGNISPKANAGPDQSITLPASTVSMSGSGTDTDGNISAYNWTKISGPTPGIITNTTSATTSITGLAQGVYQFQLKVTDNAGGTGLDTVQVTVNAAGGLLPAVNPANTVNGLDYKYYEGSSYNVVPIFSTLTPVKTGTTTNFNISLANRTTGFSFNFTGFIKVPSDGQYTFYTTSDDGSNLYLDNVLVVNNDGLHGSVEKSGTIGLKAGKHAISVGYFQQGGGRVLTVKYSGPGIFKRAVPASALYRISSSGLVARANNNQIISFPTQAGITAYPNPVINDIEMSITGGVAGKYKLILLDASGRVVWTVSGIKNAGAFQQSINTSTLERGLYFLKVIQNNTSSVIKLVK